MSLQLALDKETFSVRELFQLPSYYTIPQNCSDISENERRSRLHDVSALYIFIYVFMEALTHMCALHTYYIRVELCMCVPVGVLKPSE